MQFGKDIRDDVAAGRITVTIRLWSRPQVKVRGRYAVGAAQIEIDSIELLPFGAVPDEDLGLMGEPDRESARARAAHAGPVHDDTPVYRIGFHVVR